MTGDMNDFLDIIERVDRAATPRMTMDLRDVPGALRMRLASAALDLLDELIPGTAADWEDAEHTAKRDALYPLAMQLAWRLRHVRPLPE